MSLLVEKWIPIAKFYGWLRLFRSVLRASKLSVFRLIENVILWAYYTIPFCLTFFWHFLAHPEPNARVSFCHSASSVPLSSVNFSHFNFFSRTAWWIFLKLGRDEVLMVPFKCCCFFRPDPPSRAVQKICHWGPLLQKKLLRTGRLQQQTKCIAMI